MNIRIGILTAPHIDFEQREHTFVLKNVRIGIGFHVITRMAHKQPSTPLIWRTTSVRSFPPK